MWVLRPPSGGFTEQRWPQVGFTSGPHGHGGPPPPILPDSAEHRQGPPPPPLPCFVCGQEEPGNSPRRQGLVRATIGQTTAGWNGPGRGDDGTPHRPQPGLSLPNHDRQRTAGAPGPAPRLSLVVRTGTAGGHSGSFGTRPAVRARGGPGTPRRRRAGDPGPAAPPPHQASRPTRTPPEPADRRPRADPRPFCVGPQLALPATAGTHGEELTADEPRNGRLPTAPRTRPVPDVHSRPALPRPVRGWRHHVDPPPCQRFPRPGLTWPSSPPPFAGFRVRKRSLVRVFRLCAGAVPLPRRLAI